ncbi:GIY-YIG nuclease family protein [Flagellimonas profundi]|uniref:GIY-YIG nuclease family protein n=1 Tax=Flagellimonas profundi TaxID=2915620 RepID=A0ABS3FFP2_9FLAO|nr:GIY-YIG nuclease family protein [Allomuricauda profundi]
MEYFVYILYSQSIDKFYVGHCQNLEDRISRHNGGRSKYTKIAMDWEVKYIESFSTRGKARAFRRHSFWLLVFLKVGNLA